MKSNFCFFSFMLFFIISNFINCIQNEKDKIFARILRKDIVSLSFNSSPFCNSFLLQKDGKTEKIIKINTVYFSI